jgi:hypothetical protein
VVALRAGYLAFVSSLVGTALVALLLLAPPPPPRTIVDALAAPLDDALAQRRIWAVEATTQACMVALGLPYTPRSDPEPAIPDAHLDPVAWAERWGFGIATSVGKTTPLVAPDPDADYLAGLHGSARARYVAALYGDGTGRGGCHGSAIDAVHGLRDRELAALRGPLADLERAIAVDPARSTAMAAWAACIRALGIPDTHRATLIGRMRASFTDRAARALSDRQLLDAVAEDERRVAAGIARCEADHVAQMAIVVAPHEARFVARHRALLARIGDRIRAVEAAYPVSPPPVRAPDPAVGDR